MTLQPSHRDYFSYREGQGYEKPFNPDKSSFERGLSSNWPYTINSPLPNYNLNPSVPSHLSFMKTYPVNLYGGRNEIWKIISLTVISWIIICNVIHNYMIFYHLFIVIKGINHPLIIPTKSLWAMLIIHWLLHKVWNTGTSSLHPRVTWSK